MSNVYKNVTNLPVYASHDNFKHVFLQLIYRMFIHIDFISADSTVDSNEIDEFRDKFLFEEILYSLRTGAGRRLTKVGTECIESLISDHGQVLPLFDQLLGFLEHHSKSVIQLEEKKNPQTYSSDLLVSGVFHCLDLLFSKFPVDKSIEYKDNQENFIGFSLSHWMRVVDICETYLGSKELNLKDLRTASEIVTSVLHLLRNLCTIDVSLDGENPTDTKILDVLSGLISESVFGSLRNSMGTKFRHETKVLLERIAKNHKTCEFLFRCVPSEDHPLVSNIQKTVNRMLSKTRSEQQGKDKPQESMDELRRSKGILIGNELPLEEEEELKEEESMFFGLQTLGKRKQAMHPNPNLGKKINRQKKKRQVQSNPNMSPYQFTQFGSTSFGKKKKLAHQQKIKGLFKQKKKRRG